MKGMSTMALFEKKCSESRDVFLTASNRNLRNVFFIVFVEGIFPSNEFVLTFNFEHSSSKHQFGVVLPYFIIEKVTNKFAYLIILKIPTSFIDS